MTSDEILMALAQPGARSAPVVKNPFAGQDRLPIEVYSADFDRRKIADGIANMLAFIETQPQAVETAIWGAMEENFDENDGEF